MFVSWYCKLVRLEDITAQEERQQEKRTSKRARTVASLVEATREIGPATKPKLSPLFLRHLEKKDQQLSPNCRLSS